MKNIEKYTNTKGALEAYNKLDFKKVSFDKWLELEYEEPRAQTLLEAAEAVINEWYYTQDNVTLNDIGEKMVDLKKAIDREKDKLVRNCDKYKTAEEACRAFSNLCQKEDDCLHCRFKSTKFEECSIAWAYEAADTWAYEEAEKEDAK